MEKENHGAGLTVPQIQRSVCRADVMGASPICMGNNRSQSVTSDPDRSRSPTRLSTTIGVPLYHRSRSASSSPCMDGGEMRNLARQPSRTDSPQGAIDDLRNHREQSPKFTNREAGNQDTYGNCHCTAAFTPHMEDAFRRRLRFYFMNPCQKWRAKKRFPYKLILQVLKLVIVTIQLMFFGTERSGHVDFIERNNLALKHLYLSKWDATYETFPYPPAIGDFAVYEINTILDGIDYTMNRYNETRIIAIGSYDFANDDGTMPPPELCVTKFARGQIWPHNQSYAFNATVVHECFPVTPVKVSNPMTNTTEEKYDIRQFFKENNRSIYFDRLNMLEIKFPLRTVHLKIRNLEGMTEADCFQFNVTILYDNSKHNGQVPVTLNTAVLTGQCKNQTIVHGSNGAYRLTKRIVDTLVIIVGTLSFILCLRTLYRAHKLKRMAVHFFKFRYNRMLTFYECTDFLNLWDVLILINDILTVTGTVLKIMIEQRNSDDYEVAGMLLGVGNLLVWLGVLRYLSVFEHYNILILTMKQALPDIGRFLVCASVLYLGFAICGWVVLGPYHIKFATISQATECLFALVNGDEIFVTFADVRSNNNNYVYYFSRIYLYVFISLFMYVVYSIFTSIIITTYETIKFYYREGFPKGVLQNFIDEHEEDENSPLFLADDAQAGDCYFCLFPCMSCCSCLKRRTRDSYPDEYTPLLN